MTMLKRSLLLCLVLVGVLAAPAAAQKPINVKILGGNVAAPGQFPWMAALVGAEDTGRSRAFCGGTVIAPKVILTAAHCTEGSAPEEIDVIVGRIRLSRNRTGERFDVTAIVTHPEWDSVGLLNDIVLLQLDRPVQVPAMGLPRPQDLGRERPPARLTTSGWGLTTEGGQRSDDLRYVGLYVRPTTPCAARYRPYTGKTQLCAGSPRAGEDSCQGDSGGPLFSGEGATARVHGIVSWGHGCGRKNVPGVYTRVSAFTPWIVDNMTNLNGDAPSPPPPAGDAPVVSIGAVRCGAIYCNVALSVKGRAPAGGILVNAARTRTKKRKAVDRSVFAKELSPGRWRARINLPVGRISLYAFPLDAKRELLDGKGDAEKFVVTIG